jgi:hypothetical protein
VADKVLSRGFSSKHSVMESNYKKMDLYYVKHSLLRYGSPDLHNRVQDLILRYITCGSRRESGTAGTLICWTLRTTCRGRHRGICACRSCKPVVEGCGCSCEECCNRLGIPPRPQTPYQNYSSRCELPQPWHHSAQNNEPS